MQAICKNIFNLFLKCAQFAQNQGFDGKKNLLNI
jgi:hypothetical protein